MPESKPSQLRAPDTNPSAGKFIVSPDHAGRRLDQFLAATIPDVSRTRVPQLIAQQQILVNGKEQKSSYSVESCYEIHLIVPIKLPPLHAEPEDIPLDIV